MTALTWVLRALGLYAPRDGVKPSQAPVKRPVIVPIDETLIFSVQDVTPIKPIEVIMQTSYTPAFLAAVNYVLEHEGGYVSHPKDPGGATNMGITLKTLARWRDVHYSQISPDDVKNMSRDEAIEIYDAMYWDAVRADRLPPALAYAAFDFAVNSGPVRAVKELQKLVGTKADGILGGHTMRRISDVNDREDLVNKYMDARLDFMKKARHRDTGALLWPTFKNGWSKRVADVRRRSLEHTGGGGSW